MNNIPIINLLFNFSRNFLRLQEEERKKCLDKLRIGDDYERIKKANTNSN